jgi:hypothetical protein
MPLVFELGELYDPDASLPPADDIDRFASAERERRMENFYAEEQLSVG